MDGWMDLHHFAIFLADDQVLGRLFGNSSPLFSLPSASSEIRSHKVWIWLKIDVSYVLNAACDKP